MRTVAAAILVAAAAPDRVSPITAAGSETAVNLDWNDEVRHSPAGKIFKNVKVLRDVPAERFMAAMQSMRANLGEKCLYCHDVAAQDYAADRMKPKLRAREMIGLDDAINQRMFGGKARVTCWTCHRGEAKPPSIAFSRDLPPVFAKLVREAQLTQPAEKVFKDVRQLQGMDARNFGLIMGWFARELGVKCTHCHDANDFAVETEKKTVARQMLQMAGWIGSEYYGNDSPIGCGTCHRGSVKPPRTPADVTPR